MTLLEYYQIIKQKLENGDYYIIPPGSVGVGDAFSPHLEAIQYIMYEYWLDKEDPRRGEVFQTVYVPRGVNEGSTDIDFTKWSPEQFFTKLCELKTGMVNVDNVKNPDILKQDQIPDYLEYGLGGVYYLKSKSGIYVGETNDFFKRKNEHFIQLQNGNHHNKNLQFDYNQTGILPEFEVAEKLVKEQNESDNDFKTRLLEREEWNIRALRGGKVKLLNE